MIACAVPVSWSSSADLFGRILREHHVEPDLVTDVEAAWSAFCDFVQTPLAGIAPGEDSDGFIVQWDRRPSLSFTRQLAVPAPGDPEEPSYWQVDLEMIFRDEPGLTGLEDVNEANSGFSFVPIGPGRHDELTALRERLHPQLRARWGAVPSASRLTLDQAC